MEIIRVNGKTTTPEFNAQLNNLVNEVFGFSFARFQALNVWDEQYEYFSVIDDGQMVANCGVYHMEMLINGNKQHFLQFGAVAVRPSHQGKGLGRYVMEQALGSYPGVPAFLYSNQQAVGFYERLGFKRQSEKQPFITVESAPRKVGLERLEIIYPELDEYLDERNSFSPTVDCLNQYAINWFHLVYEHLNNLYHVPDLGAMVVMVESEGKIVLHDVVAPPNCKFSDLLPFIQNERLQRVEFGFCPDHLGVTYQTQVVVDPSTNLMVRGWSGDDLACYVPHLIRT